jgi:hypothetical protein
MERKYHFLRVCFPAFDRPSSLLTFFQFLLIAFLSLYLPSSLSLSALKSPFTLSSFYFPDACLYLFFLRMAVLRVSSLLLVCIC